MKVQKQTQEQPFVLHCKNEAIGNEDIQVSKPHLLSSGWEVLFLCQLGIYSFSCLKVIVVLEINI